jgi:hypothetical protein
VSGLPTVSVRATCPARRKRLQQGVFPDGLSGAADKDDPPWSPAAAPVVDSAGSCLRDVSLPSPINRRLQTFPGPGGRPLRVRRPESSNAAAHGCAKAARGDVGESKLVEGNDRSRNRAWWGCIPRGTRRCGITLCRSAHVTCIDNPSFHGASQHEKLRLVSRLSCGGWRQVQRPGRQLTCRQQGQSIATLASMSIAFHLARRIAILADVSHCLRMVNSASFFVHLPDATKHF